jgi:hypothetical protein
MTTSVLDRPRPVPSAPGDWLTATLRPAGAMTAEAADRFAAALEALAACSAVVLVDLSATGPLPRRARRALAEADAALAAGGGTLLLLDAGRLPAPLPPDAG